MSSPTVPDLNSLGVGDDAEHEQVSGCLAADSGDAQGLGDGAGLEQDESVDSGAAESRKAGEIRAENHADDGSPLYEDLDLSPMQYRLALCIRSLGRAYETGYVRVPITGMVNL